jgi:Tol biopolymer transport system component
LFPPGDHPTVPVFMFRYGGDDLGTPPIRWGLAEEVDLHRSLFNGQDRDKVTVLALSLSYSPPRDLDPPIPGRGGWKESFVSSSFLIIEQAGEEATRVVIEDTRFLMAPADGRWYLVDWYEYPASPPTWGTLKAEFLSEPIEPSEPVRQVDDWSAWSPDMSLIAYHRNVVSSQGPAGVYLIEADGTGNRLLIEGNGFEPRQLCFSPDGAHLSMTINLEIHIVDVQTGAVRQVTDSNGNAEAADWSPSGSEMVYQRSFRRSPEDTTGLYVVSVSTGQDRLIFHDGAPIGGGNPRWSPLGGEIAYSAGDPSGNVEIFTVSPDGAQLLRLTDAHQEYATATLPRWINGGERVLYTWRSLDDAGRVETRVVDAKGGNSARWPLHIGYFDAVSPDSRYIITPAPQADGTWVLFIREIDDVAGGTLRQLSSYVPVGYRDTRSRRTVRPENPVARSRRTRAAGIRPRNRESSAQCGRLLNRNE